MTDLVPLKRVASLRPSNVDKKSREGEASVRLCNYTDVYYHETIRPGMEFMPATATHDQLQHFSLRHGDVIMTKDSETADDVGIPAFVEHPPTDLVCGYHLTLIRPNRRRLDGRFLFWQMSATHVRQTWEATAAGVTRVGLRAETVANLPIRVPCLTEQQAIADYLDTETARIDALLARKGQLARLLQQRFRDRIRQSMGELFDQHGSVPLKRLVQCLDGQRVPVSSTERAQRTGPYPYYGASGVVDTIDGYLFDEELVLLGEDGAQLLDPEYRVAFVVRGKCWVNNHAHVLRPRLADAEFLAAHLATLDRMPFLSGATRPKLTQDDMGRLPVPRCDLSVQRETAMRLSHEEAQLRALTDQLDRQIELLREHRQALITAAVTGQLEVPGVAA